MHGLSWLVINDLDVYSVISIPGSAIVLEEPRLNGSVTIFGVTGRVLFQVRPPGACFVAALSQWWPQPIWGEWRTVLTASKAYSSLRWALACGPEQQLSTHSGHPRC